MTRLTPDGYRRLAMPDLVAMTWDRIETLEREHYGLILVTLEQGASADDEARLDDLERRRDVQLARLMPADAHDEVPGERTEHPEPRGDEAPVDEAPADEAPQGAPAVDPVVDPVVDEAPVDEAPVDEAPVDEDPPPARRGSRARARGKDSGTP